jgi:hypothetical protein
MIRFDGLCHHAGYDAKTTEISFVIAIRIEHEVHAERANRPAVHEEGNTHKCDIPLVEILAAANTIQEHRLAAHLGHDNGLAGFNDSACDPFAEPIVSAPAGITESDGSFDADFSCIAIEDSNCASQDFVMLFENFQNALKSGSRRQCGA